MYHHYHRRPSIVFYVKLISFERGQVKCHVDVILSKIFRTLTLLKLLCNLSTFLKTAVIFPNLADYCRIFGKFCLKDLSNVGFYAFHVVLFNAFVMSLIEES